jgi:PST family polysaccharide transporter
MAWLASEHVAKMLIGFLTSIFVIRYLGPEQFGLLSFLASITSILAVIISMGMHEIIVRDLTRKKYNSKELLPSVLAGQLLLALVIVGLILVFGGLFVRDQYERQLLNILLVSLIFPGSEAFRAYFLYRSESKYYVFCSLTMMVISLVLKLYLIFFDYPLKYFAAMFVFDAVLMVSLLLFNYLRVSGHSLQVKFNAKIFHELFKDSWPLLIMAVSVVIYSKVDQIMIKQMVGSHAVGIYSSALRLAEAWFSISMVIIGSFFPALVKYKEEREELYLEKLQKLIDALFWLSVLVAAIATVGSHWIITTLFGSAFAEGSTVFTILMWCGVFMFVGAAGGRFFVIEEMSKTLLARTLIALSINIFLNFLLIPVYGVVGAALALTIATGYVAYIHDLFSRRGRVILVMKLRSMVGWSLFWD